MIISITEAERKERISKIRAAINENGYKAMVFVADSHLGKKGSLRYLFDNHLIHRFGYGLVLPEEQYQILPSGLHWCTDRRVPDTLFPHDHEVLELARRLHEAGIKEGTIGVVGLNNTMKLEDYQHLTEQFPNVDFVDATIVFEKIRSIKSDAELEGVRESNRIIEEGFDRIIESIQVGMTEEEAVAVAYEEVHKLGAKDTLFLTLSSDNPAEVEPYFLNPRPRVIHKGDYLIVSLEITGPTGHWVEHSRMFCFGERNEEMESLIKTVAKGLEMAEQEMKPGVRAIDIQLKLEEIAQQDGYLCGHLSGHGIGMDVIERPLLAKPLDIDFVGVEVPTDNDDLTVLQEGMVISFHPQIVHPNQKQSAYMSDIFIITKNGAERLSKRGHESIFINA